MVHALRSPLWWMQATSGCRRHRTPVLYITRYHVMQGTCCSMVAVVPDSLIAAFARATPRRVLQAIDHGLHHVRVIGPVLRRLGAAAVGIGAKAGQPKPGARVARVDAPHDATEARAAGRRCRMGVTATIGR